MKNNEPEWVCFPLYEEGTLNIIKGIEASCMPMKGDIIRIEHTDGRVGVELYEVTRFLFSGEPGGMLHPSPVAKRIS